MDDSRLYLVFEFVPMDLKKFIESKPKKQLDENTTRSFTYQVHFEKTHIFNMLFALLLLIILLCTAYVIVISCHIFLSYKTNFA